MNIENLDDNRKTKLFNSALKEFVSEGYDKASTNIIAKNAGLSKALMFHYIESKEKLFLLVYDYFENIVENEYYSKMDFSIPDIFERLRRSYILQINLIKQVPWIVEFNKLCIPTNSDFINTELNKRDSKKHRILDKKLIEIKDFSNFRNNLDFEKSKKIILWINIGFTNQILESIKKNVGENIDSSQIITQIDEYLVETKKLFYKTSE